MRSLARLVVVVGALVVVAIVLWPWSPRGRLIVWGSGVLAATYLRLKEPGNKGTSTILALVAGALALFTALYLTPAGITTGVHELGLWAVTIALVLWDRSRS